MEKVTKLTDLIPRSDNPSLWHGNVMPALQSQFLDWLLTPTQDRDPKTQTEWAEAHDLARGTLAAWKKDRRFLREWEDRANARNIGVERMQNVLSTLYTAAVSGDVQAAKLYIAEVDKMRPPKQVQLDKDVEGLSDEELADELRGLLGGDVDVEEAESAEQGEGEGGQA